MTDFTFVDLFAGIGGIRIAFEDAGGNCVFSSEYDRYAQKTYNAFFGELPDFSDHYSVDPPGDITKIPVDLLEQVIPDHDILTAGFPCQPFSLAGVSKKQSLGRPHGFDDPTQGTLFFNIKEILAAKRPKAFLLENVKNLKAHDKGRTYKIIIQTLGSLGYSMASRVIDAAGWVPQHRERIYFLGFRKDLMDELQVVQFEEELKRITPPKKGINLEHIIEDEVPNKYTLGRGTWSTLKRHKKYHTSIGQGFGFGRIEEPYDGKITRTLSARYHKDGAEILLSRGGRKNPRRLTPLECCRLMGFPERYEKYFDRNDKYPQPVSDTQAYRQFGNSVAVPVVEDLARLMVDCLNSIE